MNENIVCTSKDAHFAELVLRVIDEVEYPMLMYDGEKEAVRKGLMLLLDRQLVDRSEQTKRGKWINLISDPKHLVSEDVCSECG